MKQYLFVTTLLILSIGFNGTCRADCVTDCASLYMSCDTKCLKDDQICQAKCQDNYKMCKDSCSTSNHSSALTQTDPSTTMRLEHNASLDKVGVWAKFKGTIQQSNDSFVLRDENNNEGAIIDKNDIRVNNGIIEVKTKAKILYIKSNTFGFGLHCNNQCCPSGDCDSTCCVSDCGMKLTCNGGKADLSCKCF